jgi:hypothetical protein
MARAIGFGTGFDPSCRAAIEFNGLVTLGHSVAAMRLLLLLLNSYGLRPCVHTQMLLKELNLVS